MRRLLFIPPRRSRRLTARATDCPFSSAFLGRLRPGEHQTSTLTDYCVLIFWRDSIRVRLLTTSPTTLIITAIRIMKTNTTILLLLSTCILLHISAAFQPLVPFSQKKLERRINRMPVTRLQSSIQRPWHHESIPIHDSHLLHEGETAKFMPKWPAIVTYTLVKGWTDETTKAFQDAVDKVVELNPILAGRVYRHRPFPIFHPRGDHFELRVDMDYYNQENHDFVKVFDRQDEAIPANMNCTSALNFMETKIIPSLGIHCESTGTEIRKKLPLFGVHVVRLPDDHACIAIKMSHCLGDGLTVSSNCACVPLVLFAHTFSPAMSQ